MPARKHRAGRGDTPGQLETTGLEQFDRAPGIPGWQPPGGRDGQHARADVDSQGPLEAIHEMGQHQARATGQVDEQPIAAKRLASGHDRIGRIEEPAVGVVLVQVAALVSQVGVPTVGLLVPTLANHLQPDFVVILRPARFHAVGVFRAGIHGKTSRGKTDAGQRNKFGSTKRNEFRSTKRAGTHYERLHGDNAAKVRLSSSRPRYCRQCQRSGMPSSAVMIRRTYCDGTIPAS